VLVQRGLLFTLNLVKFIKTNTQIRVNHIINNMGRVRGVGNPILIIDIDIRNPKL